MGESPKETKPTPPKCWACEKPVSMSQKICLECKSWQNWRKHLNISNATLSLLVALISVTATLGPVIKEEFRQKVPRVTLLHGNFRATPKATVELTFMNTGDYDVLTPEGIHCLASDNINDISQLLDVYLNNIPIIDDGLAFLSAGKINFFKSGEVTTIKYKYVDNPFFENPMSVFEEKPIKCSFHYRAVNEARVDPVLLDVSRGNVTQFIHTQ